jgi:hypothetical protein
VSEDDEEEEEEEEEELVEEEVFPAAAAAAAPPAAAPPSMAAAPEVTSAASAAAAATSRFQATGAAASAIAPQPAGAAGASAGANAATAARALQAFNLMATGVMTQDDTLLRGVASEDAFAKRVRDVAASQPASARPDPKSIMRLVDELLPLVRQLNASIDPSNPSSSSVAAAPGAEAPPQEPPRQTMSQIVATATVRRCFVSLMCVVFKSHLALLMHVLLVLLVLPSDGLPTVHPVHTRAHYATGGAVGAVQPDPEPAAGDKAGQMAARLQSLRVNLLRIATRWGCAS